MGLFSKMKKGSKAPAAAAPAAPPVARAGPSDPLSYDAPSVPPEAAITEAERRAAVAAQSENQRSDAVLMKRIQNLKGLIKQDDEVIAVLENKRRAAAMELQKILDMQFVDTGKRNRAVRNLQQIKNKINDAERRIKTNETQVDSLEVRLQQARELETLQATKEATEAKKFNKDELEDAMEDAKEFVQDVADVRAMQHGLDIGASDDVGLDDEIPDDIMHILNMENERTAAESSKVDESAALAGLSLAEPTPSAQPAMPAKPMDDDAALSSLKDAMKQGPTPAQ